MSRTPEEMAEEYCDQDEVACDAINHAAEYLVKDAFLAGYKAAENHFRDATEKVTYDYVETASNEAKKLIAEFELKGDENMLIKALVSAYCSGVDAVDGYLRNSLSAYRASIRQQRWISVKDRLPENISDVLILSKEKELCVGYYRSSDNDWNTYNPCCSFHMELHGVTHWMPLPAPPKEEE